MRRPLTGRDATATRISMVGSEEEREGGGLEPRTPKDPGQPLDPDVTEPGQQPADPDIPQEPAPEDSG